MKKFKMDRLRKSASITVIGLLFFFLWIIWEDDSISTQRFCAYGQVYVEFNHLGKTWGTTFLDEHGRPVSCIDDNTVEKHTSINAKETI